jgi:hypothetical protein
MMRKFLSDSTLSLFLASCTAVDENILPLVGIYRMHVIGVAGPLDLIICTDRRDDVIIEAPFDGFEWYTIKASTENQKEKNVNISIRNQQIANGVNKKGTGFFRDGIIELKYTVTTDCKKINFTLVGTKL